MIPPDLTYLIADDLRRTGVVSVIRDVALLKAPSTQVFILSCPLFLLPDV
jgi:hypothetical protein